MSSVELFVFLCSLVVVSSDTFSRTLTSYYNPGCEEQKQNCSLLTPSPHLLYTKAVSNSDKSNVIHYVVSAGGALGPLTVLLIRADKEESELKFNWTNLLSDNSTTRKDGIQLENGNALYQAGFVVTRMWEYNDTDDSGNMTKASQNRSLWKIWDTDEFDWIVSSTGEEMSKTHVIELTTNRTVKMKDETNEKAIVYDEATTDSPTLSTTDSNDTTTEMPPTTTTSTPIKPSGVFKNGGKLQFRIVQSGKERRPVGQPRLEFTGNSTQLDVILNNLASSFNGSRFAMTVVQLISLHDSDVLMNVKQTESVDDEFTPGIFKMFDWIAAPVKVDKKDNNHRSFLQWKPVCYTTSERHLKMSQQMFNYRPRLMDESDSDIIERSIIPSLADSLTMTDQNAMNISFGQSGDGFYKAQNYETWTTSMGLGKPPSDSVSVLVILIIVIGLGLPFIFIIIGSIYICIRRRREPTVSYESIN